MNQTDNLIFFEEEEYDNAKRIHSLELVIESLSAQLNVALNEISSLKQQLYDHINSQHDIDPPSRFRITHIPRTHSSDDSSSGEALLIDI
jgi:hypothetical protein